MASLVQTPSCQQTELPVHKGVDHTKRRLINGLQGAASAVRAASEADNVLFKKARVFMNCRPKRVLFNISHRLYQSGNLEEDIKQLKSDRYEGVVPPASLIWGERFDQDVLRSSKMLTEDNFWKFVHSVAWRKFSSIRVTEGALLESLLFTYFSLVKEGKLYSYTTDVLQKNDSKTKQDKSDKKNQNATMKITFTYYAPSLRALSEIIYRHQGSRVSVDTFAAEQIQSPIKQPTASPDVSLDLAWSPEMKESQASISHVARATPVNPPNSPTPSLTPTQTMLKKRKDQLLISGRQNDIVKYPSSYYRLPLVLRNRFTFGMKLKGDDGMAIEGKTLQSRREDEGQFTPCSELYLTREKSKVDGYKSSLQAVRASYVSRSQTVHLPYLTPSAGRKDVLNNTPEKTGDVSSPLHSCLATPSHPPREKNSPDPESSASVRPDSKRTLTFSPNLEYINVVHPVTPGPAARPRLPGTINFDTKKLYINWSLDKMRRARRRGKYRRKIGPSQKALLKKLQNQETDKDYVLGKFFTEQPVRVLKLTADDDLSENCPIHTVQDVQCEQCLEQQPQRGPLTIITNHSEVRKIRFNSSIGRGNRAGALSTIPPGYADTVADFRHGCYISTKQFIIRKEQVTTSNPILTVTSLTINKIPVEGFAKWQYKTDDAVLEK